MNLKLTLLCLISLVAIVCAKSVTQGQRESGDKILYRRHVQAGKKPLWGKQYRQIVYPEKGVEGGPIITLVNITDNKYPDSKKGGKPTISSGGVGYTYAVIDFVSAGGKAINFDVAIYGK